MTKRVTVKPLMFIEECRNGIFEYNGERLTNNEIVKLVDAQHEQIQILKASNGEMEDYLARLEEENQQSKVLIKKYHNENTDLIKENEQLKKGMIEVVDRYIQNVEHNPPQSARTYLKVKGALNNVREGLRDLLEDLE